MEPIESSETSASNTQTPGNYPKERKPYGGILFDRPKPTAGCSANGEEEEIGFIA
jgi:hypothetical protein